MAFYSKKIVCTSLFTVILFGNYIHLQIPECISVGAHVKLNNNICTFLHKFPPHAHAHKLFFNQTTRKRHYCDAEQAWMDNALQWYQWKFINDVGKIVILSGKYTKEMSYNDIQIRTKKKAHFENVCYLSFMQNNKYIVR